MKKIAMFFLLTVIIIGSISYLYLNYTATYNESKKENTQFESYYNQEIYGAEVSTIINKAMDNNNKNLVQKDEEGNYVNNNQNSIKIDLQISDNDNSIYNMEKLFWGTGGMATFAQYYGQIKFKCTKIEYHQSTNKVKYMLFEQLTQ